MPIRPKKLQENSDEWTLDEYAKRIASVCTLTAKEIRKKFRRRSDMDAFVLLMGKSCSREKRETRTAELRREVRKAVVAETALKMIRMFPDHSGDPEKDPLAKLRSIARSRLTTKTAKVKSFRKMIRQDAAAGAFMRGVKARFCL